MDSCGATQRQAMTTRPVLSVLTSLDNVLMLVLRSFGHVVNVGFEILGHVVNVAV